MSENSKSSHHANVVNISVFEVADRSFLVGGLNLGQVVSVETMKH